MLLLLCMHGMMLATPKDYIGKICRIGKVVDITTCMQRTLQRYILGLSIRLKPPALRRQSETDDTDVSLWG